jgi:hypothetical protein
LKNREGKVALSASALGVIAGKIRWKTFSRSKRIKTGKDWGCRV